MYVVIDGYETVIGVYSDRQQAEKVVNDIPQSCVVEREILGEYEVHILIMMDSDSESGQSPNEKYPCANVTNSILA